MEKAIEKSLLTMPKVLYVCDPNMNTPCIKTGCQDPDRCCSMTRHAAYAKTDSKGQPIVAALITPQGTVEYVDGER